MCPTTSGRSILFTNVFVSRASFLSRANQFGCPPAKILVFNVLKGSCIEGVVPNQAMWSLYEDIGPSSDLVSRLIHAWRHRLKDPGKGPCLQTPSPFFHAPHNVQLCFPTFSLHGGLSHHRCIVAGQETIHETITQNHEPMQTFFSF